MRVLINDYLTEVERVHFDEKKTKDDINSGLLGAKTISSSKGCLILEDRNSNYLYFCDKSTGEAIKKFLLKNGYYEKNLNCKVESKKTYPCIP